MLNVYNQQKFWHRVILMLICLLCTNVLASTPQRVNAFFILNENTETQIEAVEQALESVAVGELRKLPLRIDWAPAWKSATISMTVENYLHYEADTTVVQLSDVILTASEQAPITAYIPIMISGEGWFEVKGTLHIDLDDGNVPSQGNENNSFDLPLHFGVISQGGKAYFANSASEAMEVYARKRLELQGGGVFSRINQKQEMSTSDREKLSEIIRNEYDNLWKEYDEKYSTDKKDKVLLKNTPVSLVKGEQHTIEIFWPKDNAASGFLPVDGAMIELENNNTDPKVKSTDPIQGKVENGKFAFLSDIIFF